MSGRRGPHYQRALPFSLGGGAKRRALDEQLAHLREAAEAGDREATLLLGKMLWCTDGRRSEGIAWLRRAAEGGQAEALHVLGLACLRGQGVGKDVAEARRLQQEAAERGVVDAQFELSLLLARGIGGKRDARSAARWEAKAAEAGHARACLNRAARLASARKPDFAAAARWYERAAEGGDAEAAARLCKMHLAGQGVARDEAAARLCKMHLAGQGVARDEAAARRWYERALELGYDWEPESRR